MKKLKVDIYSPTSEAVLAEVLEKTGAGTKENNAATIVRDSNGKVVRVEVNLPDTASANAVAALASCPGLATIVTDPIGDVLYHWNINSGDPRLDQIWTLVDEDGTITVESDGIKVAPDAIGMGKLRLTSSNLIFPGDANTDYYVRMKIEKSISGTQHCNAILFAQWGVVRGRLQYIDRGSENGNADFIYTGGGSEVVNIADGVADVKMEIQTNFSDRVSYQVDDVEYPTAGDAELRNYSIGATGLDLMLYTYTAGSYLKLKEITVQAVSV